MRLKCENAQLGTQAEEASAKIGMLQRENRRLAGEDGESHAKLSREIADLKHENTWLATQVEVANTEVMRLKCENARCCSGTDDRSAEIAMLKRENAQLVAQAE